MSDPEALSSTQFFYAGAHLVSPPSDRRHGIVDETLTPRSRPDVAVIVTTAVAHRSCSCSSTFSDVLRSPHVSQAAGVSRNQDGPCYHVAEAARVEMLHPRLTRREQTLDLTNSVSGERLPPARISTDTAQSN
ncbi:hypothetical protein T02_16027 [Trichinella nativa]|uniref:Uncharacterized protein n=1 Tax=Trichinella nativa TaxID=6335 RepID=A0A0V1KLL4_9BILA|nr:hypothetical protein T02_16027 [Trichinella nativa]